MSATFLTGTDWQCSSGPILPRPYDASADVWPHGLTGKAAGGACDVLEDGHHMFFAIGPKAERPRNITGVSINYHSGTDRVVMNLADKFVAKAYVANVLTYSGATPNTFDTSLVIGEPVYVDDSDTIAAGVTLSRSPLNQADSPNPLAGYLYYAQDDFDDSYIGGAGATVSWPITVANSLVYTLVCVVSVNDYGYQAAA